MQCSTYMNLKNIYRVSSDIPIASRYRSHNNGNSFKNSVVSELLSCVGNSMCSFECFPTV